MSIQKPYKRTCRVFIDNAYGNDAKSEYIIHPDYADSPGNFIRSFLIIQKDLLTLFDYVEPSEKNLRTHSFRIHELLLRTCVDVEANCKAILRENGYKRNDKKNWTMSDYKKVEQSHFLSKYEVMLPNWIGQSNTRIPYTNWSANSEKNTLDWYKAYNETKHDRYRNFDLANFDILIKAVCGLAALIAGQFWTYSFSPADTLLSEGDSNRDGFKSGIGNFFKIKFPTELPDSEKYSFEHKDIRFDEDIFQKFEYR